MGLDRTRPVIFSDRSPRASDEFSHEIHLYADSHSNPEFPNDHVHTHTALKNDLLKEDLESNLRKYDSGLYFQSFHKIGIRWHGHHMKMEMKHPKTDAVMATRDHIPY